MNATEPTSPAPEPPRLFRRTWPWCVGLIAIIPLVLILAFFSAVRNASRYVDEARRQVRLSIQDYQGKSVRRPPYIEPSVEGDAWSAHTAAIASIMNDLSIEEREIIDGAFIEDPFAPEHESQRAVRKAIVQKLEPKVAALRRGLSLAWVTPRFDWERGLEQESFLLAGQLTFFRALALIGRERGLEGRQAESLELLGIGMAIAEDLSTNSVLIVDLVREVCQDRLREEIRAILNDYALSVTALRELLRLLEAIEARRAGIADILTREILCMKVSALAAMDKIAGMNLGLNPMPRYWFSNRVLMADALRTFDRIAVEVQQLRGRSPREAADAQPWTRHYDSPNPFVALLSPSLAKVWTLEKRHRALLTLLKCAVAIACYQAETGRPPATLNDLLPKYLTSLPMDPYSQGGMLVYRVDGLVATLYSLGEDGDDDGGRAAPEDDPGTRDCDLVWTVKRKP